MNIVSRRSGKSLAALAVTFGLIACHRSPQTVDEVIDLNTQAMGGQKAVEAVQSIAVDLHIVDPGFAADGTYRATRPAGCASM